VCHVGGEAKAREHARHDHLADLVILGKEDAPAIARVE
jgi:hypothetical protein